MLVTQIPQRKCFNPRSRAGSDTYRQVSPYRQVCFNPRSRAGSDNTLPTRRAVVVQFQSTLPRGERLAQGFSVIGGYTVSIHAPARGATYEQWDPADIKPVSIHAPARGATTGELYILHGYDVSIHAPARGATTQRR